MKGPWEGGEVKTWGDPKGQMVIALVSPGKLRTDVPRMGEEGV